MGPKLFNVVFDNPNRTFYAGQTVSGRLEVTFDAPKKVRGILLKFRGEAKVRWTEHQTTRSNGRTHSHTVSFVGEEHYLRIQQNCFSGPNGNSIEINAGTYTYYFVFTLPIGIPSSFEHQYGRIRYFVKAVIDRPWKFDYKKEAPFTVISQFDLNRNPILRDPGGVMIDKNLYCCWCKRGSISCVVSTPKTGFVPGEPLQIFAEIDNGSTVNVHKVTFQLVKLVTCHSLSPRRTTKQLEQIIQSNSFGPVPGGSTKTYSPTIIIPPLAPSNFEYCSIIDLEYKIRIKVEFDGLHINTSGSIPISIGTIPIWVTPSAPDMPPPYEELPPMGWVIDGNAPPFEIGDAEKKDDKKGILLEAQPFYPMYPVYQFSNPSI